MESWGNRFCFELSFVGQKEIQFSVAHRHAHKHTVMEVKWNANGNWLLTASRDHHVKLFDIRNMKDEMQTFKGHKKEATSKFVIGRCPFELP